MGYIFEMKMKFLAIALLPFALAACQSSDVQMVKDTVVNVIQQQNADQVLTDYQWSYQPAETQTPIVLTFAKQDQRLSIATGCNTQGTTWNLDKGQLVTGNLMSTMKACSPELMNQEKLSSSIFNKRNIAFNLNTTEAENPTLTVSNAKGEKFVFQGKMTPEAQYQTQAEIIFLEIAPETKPCTGVAPQTCLQVREVKYDEKGLKTQVDKDWTYFYSGIEGYNHVPKQRQIVRVKRYEIKNPAADQSKYAYVQDMIVESEIVK